MDDCETYNASHIYHFSAFWRLVGLRGTKSRRPYYKIGETVENKRKDVLGELGVRLLDVYRGGYSSIVIYLGGGILSRLF